MSRLAGIHRPFFVSLTLACAAAAWGGCASSQQPVTSTSSSTGGAAGGTGGTDIGLDGGDDGGGVDGGVCTSTSAVAHRVPLDIIFAIDRSESMMEGKKWPGTIKALTTFVNDPASIGVSAGLIFFPSLTGSTCAVTSYETLDVPIDVLPKNAFALTNAVPATATGWGSPIYGALTGSLMVATSHQDAHPDHKVIVVLATDGEPWCPPPGPAETIDQSVASAQAARAYNGVLTYVIGVQGSSIASLDKIAAAGGTTASYDITSDITQFAAKLAEIRGAALGCDYAIPPVPGNQQIDPTKVNFSYTPNGVGSPKILPRADDLADCNGQPGWYFNSNAAPTKIILCPSSCATVQADGNASVSVLFGCKSVAN